MDCPNLCGQYKNTPMVGFHLFYHRGALFSIVRFYWTCALLTRFLLFIGSRIICQADKIIYTCVIKLREFYQNIYRNVEIAKLIIRICGLMYLQILCNLRLIDIAVFP